MKETSPTAAYDTTRHITRCTSAWIKGRCSTSLVCDTRIVPFVSDIHRFDSDFSAASLESPPGFHLTFPGGGKGGGAQEVGMITESGKCCGPCLIVSDNFTTYIVTSWPIPHRCFLIYILLYSFAAARSASPLSLIVKMIFFFYVLTL